MLHDVQYSNVRLLIGCPKVFLMVSHQVVLMYVITITLILFPDLRVLRSLQEAVPTPPQHRKEARFLVAYSTAAPPMSMIHHRPLLSTGLETF